MAFNYSSNYINMKPSYMFRNETSYTEMEKRQLFLRSYQFSRKQSVAERIKRSFFRVRKVISLRFRSAGKLRKMIWFNFSNGFFLTSRRRRFFLRLHKNNYNYNYNYNNYYSQNGVSRSSSRRFACFW